MALEKVAPFAGVWIEILLDVGPAANATVAPFAGVWIEILRIRPAVGRPRVAPFAGVWIEIIRRIQRLSLSWGRTLRGCVD